jgi:recombination protein RecR
MKHLPPPLQHLVEQLHRLPGIGPRSAERIALHLVQSGGDLSGSLAQALLSARDTVAQCQRCGGLTEIQPCPLCTSSTREVQVVCVVERALDIFSIEKTGQFRGLYHCLGGRISPLNGVGPEDLRIDLLARRLEQEPLQELILALGSDVEGEATAHYLSRRFQRPGLRITRLAQGLPAGSGLEYADDLTLARALEGRHELR